MMAGCYTVRYVEPGEYLLGNAVKVEHEGKMKSSTLQEAITTRPNRKILSRRSFLHIYNFGRSLREDASWVKRQLLKIPSFRQAFQKTTNWLVDGIGEPPVLLKKQALQRDSLNLFNTCFAHGYLNPVIDYRIDTINTHWTRRRANVTFVVNEQQAYKLSRITYDIQDMSLLEAYGIQESFLKVGENYNHDLLSRERARATQALRDAGYFSFAQKFIYFDVDTSMQAPGEELDYVPVALTVRLTEVPPRFRINEILLTLRAPSDAIDIRQALKDTLRAETLSEERRSFLRLDQKQLNDSLRLTFVATATIIRELNYNFIAERVHLQEGNFYSLEAARLTQRRLQELGMFQFAIVNYEVVDSARLDVKIDMQMAAQYQLRAGFETFTNDITTSTNLPSIGANFTFRNKNTFGHSERLEWNLGGNIGFYATDEDEGQFENILYELGTSASLNFPRLLLPFIGRQSEGQFSPSTILNGSFRIENLEEYNRLTLGGRLNYRWNHDPFSQRTFSQLTPIAIDFIDIDNISPDFARTIEGLPSSIQRDYESRFSSRLSYTFTHATYATTRAVPTYFLRLSAEIGGNIPRLIDQVIQGGGRDNSSSDNRLFDRFFYAQYAKASLEGKYFYPLGQNSELVFRGIMGYARAYNTTPVVPQESRFFSGGTNSMRGWQSNTLGPGTLDLQEFLQATNDTVTSISLAAPGGEVLFELNAELRFDLSTYFELALFTDWGNVWFNPARARLGIDDETEIPVEGTFRRENLKLGWDAGIGLRFDFSFLILRVDIGQQLFAPDRGWVINRLFRESFLRSTQLNLGIGYPF